MLTIKARNPFYANGPYYIWVTGELAKVGRLDSFYLAAWGIPGTDNLSHLAICMGKNKQGKQIYVQSIPDVLSEIRDALAPAWPQVLEMLKHAELDSTTGRPKTVELSIHVPETAAHLYETHRPRSSSLEGTRIFDHWSE